MRTHEEHIKLDPAQRDSFAKRRDSPLGSIGQLSGCPEYTLAVHTHIAVASRTTEQPHPYPGERVEL